MNIHLADACLNSGLFIRRRSWPEDRMLHKCLCGCAAMYDTLHQIPFPDDIEAEDWETAGRPQ